MTDRRLRLPAPGLRGWLLAPVAAVRARRWTCGGAMRPDEDAGLPPAAPASPGAPLRTVVIAAVGVTGPGSGVTPVLVSVATDLARRGLSVHCVAKAPSDGVPAVRVDPRRDRIARVGTAALHLSAFAPTWSAPTAAAGSAAATGAGADVVLIEEGFGPPRTAAGPACDIVLAAVRLGGPHPLGNGRLWPAGPLVLPPACLVARDTMVVAHGSDTARDAFRDAWLSRLPGLDPLPGDLRPLMMGLTWKGQRLFAFSAIARPERMFDTLRQLGARVVRAVALPHRQPISARLLARLDLEARLTGAQLVTTDEDALSLPQAVRSRVLTLPMRLTATDWTPLVQRIAALRGQAS